MQAAVGAAFDVIAKVHALMSFQEAGSDVGRLNCEGWSRPVGVHDWTIRVLKAALDLHQQSAGAFDVAVVGEGATSTAIELLPDNHVRFTHPDVRVDLSGIAKGFAVDRALDVLRDHGMPQGLVNAGGDLAVFGPRAESVHVRDPRDPSRLLLQVAVAGRALASSGRCFDPFRSAASVPPAIIDPSTGEAVQAIHAATVRAPSCMLADGLTKVVMVAGTRASDALAHYRAGALVVRADGSIQMTEDLQDAVCLAA
jgi:FAD:protein FMN transferase